MFEASCAESSTGGELVVSCILLLGAVAVYRVQSCCAYSDETTVSADDTDLILQSEQSDARVNSRLA